MATIRPAAGVLVAIVVTTAMDAAGLTAFSALPLFPLMLLFWYLERIPRRNMGFVRGRWRDHGLAVLYPVAVLGAIALVATVTGAVDLSQTDWRKATLNLALGALSTFLVVILTEEGFFRGWLWASFEKAGQNQGRILLLSSVGFSLWHLSWVTLTEDGRLRIAQIPVYLLNAAVIGMIWGMLRWASGSVIVASLSHGVWNGMTYSLFGFGTHAGALGIGNTAIYGPEVGVLGLGLNVVFASVVWIGMIRGPESR